MFDPFSYGKICLVAASVVLWNSASSAPTPAISATPVSVAASSANSPSRASLLVTIDGFDPNTSDAILLTEPEDIKEAATTPPTVTFDKERLFPLPSNGTQRRWVLPFAVASMPAGAELTRYVRMKLGGVESTLSYKLSSPAAVATTWALKPIPVPVRAIGPDGVIPLTISVTGSATITGLKMAAAEFIEQGSKHALAGSRIALCNAPSACVGDPFPLDKVGPNIVWLAPRANGTDHETLWPGKYEGVVTLASDDKPAGESANLTIYVTAWGWQVLGFVMILMGIAAAWYFMTFLRQKLAREQMLMTAVVIRAANDTVSKTLGGLRLPIDTPMIKGKLDELEIALSDEELEHHGLPSSSPLPWPSPGAATNVDTFKVYIEPFAAWSTALQAIVRTGIEPIVKQRDDFVLANGALNAVQEAAFETALGRLDGLANQVTPPATATLAVAIETETDAFEAAILPPAHLAPQQHAKIGTDIRTPAQLRMRILVDGLLAWGFIGTVTALAGAYILVLSNPGFGTCKDLLGCLLWGLGLPTGTLLASTTTSSIATTLNVTR